MTAGKLLSLEEAVFFSLQEVQREIKSNGTSKKERALLFHQLGSLHMLLGNRSSQWIAWLKAIALDPKSSMIKESLKSLW